MEPQPNEKSDKFISDVIETTKLKTMEVTCPSGFCIKIRRLKVRELDALSSETHAKSGLTIDEVLSGVTLETIHPGPYVKPFADFSNGIKWGEVFQDDRLWIIIQLRRMKVGDKLWLKKGCPTPLCPNTITSCIDLSSLETHGLSERAEKQLKETGENQFLVRLPFEDVEVGFKCFTGIDERMTSNLVMNHRDDIATASMTVRLTRVAGADSPGKKRKFIRNMDADDYEWLREQWEETEPMISKKYRLQCRRCKEIHEVELPMGADFFSKKSARDPEI